VAMAACTAFTLLYVMKPGKLQFTAPVKRRLTQMGLVHKRTET
jgi:hypothetical protein